MQQEIGYGLHRSTVNAIDPTFGVENKLFQSATYVNGTGRTLYLSWRNGVTHRLVPENVPNVKGKLLIRKEIRFDPTNGAEIVGYNTGDPEMDTIHSQYLSSKEDFYCGLHNTFFDHHVEWTDIEKHGGTIYLSDQDMMVSIYSSDYGINHPYSNTGGLNDLIVKDILLSTSNATGVSLSIVDNSGVLGIRYVNVAGGIQKVSPYKDPKMSDGLYITKTRVVTTTDRATDPKVVRKNVFDHDYDSKTNPEPEHPVLYRTLEEARNDGDPTIIKDRQLKEREQTVKETKLKLDREKLELEQTLEKMKSEHQMEVLKQQRELSALEQKLKEEEAKRKHEGLETKDYYEERSYRRKDSSEGLKILPTILTVAVGALALAKKYG